ncbi:hypothetical protein EDD11_004504 [Mortierella claussenii]|nr:hypothetical protein EDD11_004504 [Mortierella claussenii]
MTDSSYPVGTIVFAKLKGYPWWPARIENEQDLPPNVSSKKPKQRPVWPVFFFGSYDYGWFGTSELKSLDATAAEKARSLLKKGSALRTALSEALDPTLIPHQFDANTEQDEHEDEDEHDQVPAKKKTAAKGKKAVQKSEVLEKKRRPSASEDQPAKRKVSKKSAADQDDDESTPPKAPTTARSRLESDMKSLDDDISIGDTSNGRTKRSEDDGGDSGDTRNKKKLRSGQPSERLLKLRHKLQKLLLVEGLSDEVMAQNLDRADPILTEVEAFDIDLQMLKDTKIGRLMKKISALNFGRDEHKIVQRSVKLIKQYKGMMEKAQENGETVSPSAEKTTELSTPVVESTSVEAIQETGVPEVEPSSSIAPLSNSNKHITEPSAPAPEAVVAAVAAIVETNTAFPPVKSAESSGNLEEHQGTQSESIFV